LTHYKFIDFDNVEISDDNKLDKSSSIKNNSTMNKFVDSITIEEQVGYTIVYS
jgi:hypothetical protein